MNTEIDETEFYHLDFTTASEWEVFIARMEEIIHQWKVDDNKLDDSNINKDSWYIREENIQFVDVEFILTYHKYIISDKEIKNQAEEEEDTRKPKNPIDNLYDFALYNVNDNFDNSLGVWYGLNEYISLSPCGNTGITSESQIKVLLSSVQIVLSVSGCRIPFFVQIREKWQKCYLGLYEANEIRTNFEMIHLRKGPQYCQYLTGLLDLFKTKIMSPISLDPITVSVQLTYHLNNFGNSTWKQDIDIDHDNFNMKNFCVLPFGVTFDPINLMILKTTWSHLPDHLIVDSENYSDFDPLQAPKWTVRVKMSEQPVCLLSDCMSEVLNLMNNQSTIYDVLGDFTSTADHDIDNVLDLLTESKLPTLSTVIKRATRNSLSKSRKGIAPLSEDYLVPILYFLFPDADNDPIFPYSDKQNVEKDNKELEIELSLNFHCRGIKSCPEDSLLWRLAIMLSHSLVALGGVRALSHLWFEFVQEMRYRWEKSIPVPGLAAGFPDPRTCLLHQKLQMLNCCIERKRSREMRETEPSSLNERLDEGSSTDDDEFFDCSSYKQDDEEIPKRRSKHSLWNQPKGRLGKFENLKLIKTGDPLYIPVTQDPVPKTEDQLEEDTDVLLQLGSDAQATELRAKMMSASLLSDMESFKAANPGSILEDFIRWYSPRDWIEEDEIDEWGQKRGHLSSRMLISDNTWVQMWESAKPVPANRQKRLFDDTREAEKVLHFLDSRTLAQIMEMLFPVLSHAAICRLSKECSQINSALFKSTDTIQHVIKLIEKISRDVKCSTRRCDALIQEIAAFELSLSQANSLFYKFNPCGANDEKLNDFVRNLVDGREVEVEGTSKSNVAGRITTMFSDAQKSINMILTEQGAPQNNPIGNAVFPQPTEREFVMRVLAVRPAPYSVKSPQFLRAVLSKNEFRLVGAFSEDIVFF